MPENAHEEEPEEEQVKEPAEEEGDDEKPKDIGLRSGLSKQDRAPSAPRRFTPEEIEAYLKAQKGRKRSR